MAGTSVKGFFTFEESAQGRRKRKEVFILAGVFCALVISAIVVGVSDNIPGIVLCYLATVVLVMAPIRSWRKTKRFLILLGASVGGFFVFVLLHNAFYALTIVTSHIAALSHLMEALHVTFRYRCFPVSSRLFGGSCRQHSLRHQRAAETSNWIISW